MSMVLQAVHFDDITDAFAHWRCVHAYNYWLNFTMKWQPQIENGVIYCIRFSSCTMNIIQKRHELVKLLHVGQTVSCELL